DETLSDDNINTSSNSDSDTEHTSKKLRTKTKSRKNESWVWKHFRKRLPSKKWKKRANCTVIIQDKKSPNSQRECGQLVKTQGSTGNFQSHLNTYRITKPIQKNSTTPQLTINKMFQCTVKQNSRQKESIERALVEWIVTNSQPLHHAIKLMKATISADSDSNIHKDANRLKSMMITEDEWIVLEELTMLLALFAEITELLDGSNYSTLSFLWPAITILTQNCALLVVSTNAKEIDLIDTSDVFDDIEKENIINLDEELATITTIDG
ncbi:2719_t:CDS:2, partial [Racocetra persica]